MKRILILIVLQTCIWQSYAQITVDANQLSEEIQEKLIGEITDKITSSIQSGEKWVVNETYFSEVLEPFKDFGIDPSDPNFLNQAYEIHSKIEDVITSYSIHYTKLYDILSGLNSTHLLPYIYHGKRVLQFAR